MEKVPFCSCVALCRFTYVVLNIQVMAWNSKSELTPAILHVAHSTALGVLTQFYVFIFLNFTKCQPDDDLL